jgi:hypothetical protein
MLALLGFNVDIACYSRILSNRDNDSMKNLIKNLDLY